MWTQSLNEFLGAPCRRECEMKAKVFVNLKPSILDPQGNAVAEALNTLGYKAVQDVSNLAKI